MAKRISLATLPGRPIDPAAGNEAPTSSPVLVTAETATAVGLTVVQRIPLTSIVPTPLNSRQDFGSEDELREFGDSLIRNQLQAVVVVPRTDYLELWPDHAEVTASGDFVLAAGERRWRGLKAAGADAIDAVVRSEIAQTQLVFLDALFTENFDRKNLDAIEEANAIEELVKALGTARAVAEHYGKTEGWASQRRRLLKLTGPMQRLVSRGEIPIDKARDLAKLPPDEQEHAWFELKNQPAKPRKPRKSADSPQEAASDFTAVKPGSSPTAEFRPEPAVLEAAPSTGAGFTAVLKPAASPAPTAPPAPDQRQEHSVGFTAVKPTESATRSVPERHDQPRLVTFSLDPEDSAAAVQTIREAFGIRCTARLTHALIESLRPTVTD